MLSLQIIKVDTHTKKSKYWGEPNCFLSEPVFVPKPDAKVLFFQVFLNHLIQINQINLIDYISNSYFQLFQTEDDGVVLAGMIWGGDDTKHVGLVIIDGRSFVEIGRSEFHTPSAVPNSFHGWFVQHTD